MDQLYLGLMSGTSMDGVDAAVLQFRGTRFRRIVSAHNTAYPAALRSRLLRLAGGTEQITLREYCALDQAVAQSFAAAALGALKKKRIAPARIAAIGSHGQTVFHAPEGAVRGSLQLGDPNLIAALTGTTTVADFRRKDLALGGQGAPLVPAFHHAVFASAREPRCVINIGGIANITVLPPGAEADRVFGFDTGPGNGLMDEWISARRSRPYDAGGRWAASGDVERRLLHTLLAEPWFRRRPPKSTGRDRFNLGWARSRYPALDRLPAESVQRTFAELTARSISDAILKHAPGTRRALVCGGGVRNRLLMKRLYELLAPCTVEPTSGYGLDPRWVEAAAFAWLAMRTLNGLPGNVPTVTGAKRAAVLGGIYRV